MIGAPEVNARSRYNASFRTSIFGAEAPPKGNTFVPEGKRKDRTTAELLGDYRDKDAPMAPQTSAPKMDFSNARQKKQLSLHSEVLPRTMHAAMEQMRAAKSDAMSDTASEAPPPKPAPPPRTQQQQQQRAKPATPSRDEGFGQSTMHATHSWGGSSCGRTESTRHWQVAEVSISGLGRDADDNSVRRLCQGSDIQVMKASAEVDPVRNICRGRARVTVRYDPESGPVGGLAKKLAASGLQMASGPSGIRPALRRRPYRPPREWAQRRGPARRE